MDTATEMPPSLVRFCSPVNSSFNSWIAQEERITLKIAQEEKKRENKWQQLFIV